MHEDCAALGIESPEHEPRATDYIPQIIAMTERLIERGFAYLSSNGDVLYSVADSRPTASSPGGAWRICAPARAWRSMRPSAIRWILCCGSAPSRANRLAVAMGCGAPRLAHRMLGDGVALLGEHFDLHGGGMDLKFPHHENEIAQSCAACQTS